MNTIIPNAFANAMETKVMLSKETKTQKKTGEKAKTGQMNVQPLRDMNICRHTRYVCQDSKVRAKRRDIRSLSQQRG
jgi:hypothetical protein